MIREDQSFLAEVEQRSGQQVKECYQCSKCSGGCPFSFVMDYAPNQILEMIVYGLKDEVLSSKAIQMCVQCGTCGANCPADFHLYEVMNTLRAMAKEQGVVSKEQQIPVFNKLFLDSVKDNGRLHEVGLILKHNLASGQPTKDVMLGPLMFAKGQIGFGSVFAHKINQTDQVKKIFANVERGGR